MTWEFRSRSTSRWTLTTNWGLDTISFERGLVFSVRTQWVSLHKVSERGQHCNRICSCIAVNANCSVSCCIIDEAISACFSPLRRARCLLLFLTCLTYQPVHCGTRRDAYSWRSPQGQTLHSTVHAVRKPVSEVYILTDSVNTVCPLATGQLGSLCPCRNNREMDFCQKGRKSSAELEKLISWFMILPCHHSKLPRKLQPRQNFK